MRASGLMVRISSSGPSAKRRETRTPTPSPWTTAEPVTPYERSSTPATAAAWAVREDGSDASTAAASATPRSAPPRPRMATWTT